MVTYIPRSTWRARPPRGSTPLDPAKVQGVALHWPGMQSPLGQDRIDDALRGWQNDHMDNPDKQWSDIAYQVAVDQWGRAWMLRGLTTRSAANGNQDVNERYGAILLIVAPGEKPSALMVEAVREVIADFRAEFPGADEIVPHSKIRPAPTDCPGDAVRAGITRGDYNPATEELDMAAEQAILAAIEQLSGEEKARYIAETDRWKNEADRWEVEAKRWSQLFAKLLDPKQLAAEVVAQMQPATPADATAFEAAAEAAMRKVLLEGVGV